MQNCISGASWNVVCMFFLFMSHYVSLVISGFLRTSVCFISNLRIFLKTSKCYTVCVFTDFNYEHDWVEHFSDSEPVLCCFFWSQVNFHYVRNWISKYYLRILLYYFVYFVTEIAYEKYESDSYLHCLKKEYERWFKRENTNQNHICA